MGGWVFNWGQSVGTAAELLREALHLVSHTDALYEKSPLGRLHRPVAHIGSIRLSRVHHAPSTHYQPQCGRGTDCPARWRAPIMYQVTSAQMPDRAPIFVQLRLATRPHRALHVI